MLPWLAFGDPRVVLHRFERLGKSACLNKVVPAAKGEIVLFTDANALFPRDTLKRIVWNFSDPRIGLVTGWTRYFSVDGEKEVTGLYARLERWTKGHESRIASCVGADGALFAMRRKLFVPLKGNDINDFIIPLNVIEQGLRVFRIRRPIAMNRPLTTEKRPSSARCASLTVLYGRLPATCALLTRVVMAHLPFS